MDNAKYIPKKIFIIDDEGNFLKVWRDILEMHGYEIVTLDSGDRLIEIARHEKPDLILLDVRMPGESGYDVCKSLKSDKTTSGIPVIIFTGQLLEEEGVKADSRDVGADDYILKPFDAQTLLNKIKFLIK